MKFVMTTHIALPDPNDHLKCQIKTTTGTTYLQVNT